SGHGANLADGELKPGSPRSVSEDPLFVLVARRSYKGKRRQEGEPVPQHRFFLCPELAGKTRVAKPLGATLQSLLTYQRERQVGNRERWTIRRGARRSD